MGNGMVHRIAAKAKSQHGASFSIALLLMLICVALSAAVLAAATASSGRFANQGEMDERYYAVTSAAQLFKDSLGPDGTVTYVFTQQRTGAPTSLGAAGSNLVEAYKVAGDETRGYGFLSYFTRLAFFGNGSSDASYSTWIDAPFQAGGWTASSLSETYSISGITNEGVPPEASVNVNVSATLQKDGILTLDFCNAMDKSNTVLTSSAADSAKKYHLYMILAANVDQNDAVSEPTSVTENGETTEQVTETQTTRITWSIQQILPGEA